MLPYPDFDFQFQKTQWHNARYGTIFTPHGKIHTPNFIFCGTKATVKTLAPQTLLNLDSQIILANTYHLMLQPSAPLIQNQGGLHNFMQWNNPILTDSGGYQIFAMGYGSVAEEIKGKRSSPSAPKLQIQQDGVTFHSYINGNKIFLSPETSIETQWQLGADLVVQFDECTPYHVSKEYTQIAMQRSLHWGDRSLHTFSALQKKNPKNKKPQALYAVIQGGVYPDLRKISAQYIQTQPFFGTAIGGSLGKKKIEMQKIVALTANLAPKKKPIHLLGIGNIPDIFFGVESGIDTFDCVAPTRIARHGNAILPASLLQNQSPHSNNAYTINLNNARFRQDPTPLDETSPFHVSRSFSKAYLHHLLKAKESLAPQILSAHNVGQINRLMHNIRTALQNANPNLAMQKLKNFWCL